MLEAACALVTRFSFQVFFSTVILYLETPACRCHSCNHHLWPVITPISHYLYSTHLLCVFSCVFSLIGGAGSLLLCVRDSMIYGLGVVISSRMPWFADRQTPYSLTYWWRPTWITDRHHDVPASVLLFATYRFIDRIPWFNDKYLDLPTHTMIYQHIPWFTNKYHVLPTQNHDLPTHTTIIPTNTMIYQHIPWFTDRDHDL